MRKRTDEMRLMRVLFATPVHATLAGPPDAPPEKPHLLENDDGSRKNRGRKGGRFRRGRRGEERG